MTKVDTKLVCELVEASDLVNVEWRQRGRAPVGYVKGMAVAFATLMYRGDPVVAVMSQPATGSRRQSDALDYYESEFGDLGWSNGEGGIKTLRHLFVLMYGLGMRESSGRYCEGRDRSASNVTSDTAEAGMFQMSWDARFASPHLEPLLQKYSSAKVDGYRTIFSEGVRCSNLELECYGRGNGRLFQQLCKRKPMLAVEAAAVGLRTLRRHWGPINRREVELREEANRLLLQIQNRIAPTV